MVLVFGTVGIVLISIPVFTDMAKINYQMTLLALVASLSVATVSIIAKGIKCPDAIVTISV